MHVFERRLNKTKEGNEVDSTFIIGDEDGVCPVEPNDDDKATSEPTEVFVDKFSQQAVDSDVVDDLIEKEDDIIISELKKTKEEISSLALIQCRSWTSTFPRRRIVHHRI